MLTSYKQNFLFFIVCFSFLLKSFSSVLAVETAVIQSPADLLPLLEAHSNDLPLLEENTNKAEALLKKLQGGFYYPTIGNTLSYSDNHREPTNTFEPANRKDFFWQLYLESKTPFGVKFSAGKNLSVSTFGQSIPPNSFLPYPQTYYQPEIFFQASLNLTQDLLGFITQKQLSLARHDVSIAHTQHLLLKHKLLVSALEIYYQIFILDRIQSYYRDILVDLKSLEALVGDKVEKQLSEKSELLQVQSLLFQQKAMLQSHQKTSVDLQHALALLLGVDSLRVMPFKNLEQVQSKIGHCEREMLNTDFEMALSDEKNIFDEQIEKSQLQGKLYKRMLLPDVNLKGRVSSTGTDIRYSKSMEELGSWNRPVYQVGLDFLWQPSPKNSQAARQIAEAEIHMAELQKQKREQEQSTAWSQAKQDIGLLKKQFELAQRALNASRKQVEELKNQYGMGRTSLFELAQQRMHVLETGVQMENVRHEQISNLLQPLQFVNRFKCELLP